MKNKLESIKDVLAEAKQEIFEGKSTTVKNHFHKLLGTVDGVKARRAIQIAKLDKELADADAEVARFAAMSVEDAFNEITVSNQQQAGIWTTQGTSFFGYPVVYKSSSGSGSTNCTNL